MELVRFDGTQPQGDVGHFAYDVVNDTWTWSAGMYTIHGYADKEVPATTGVLLSHKHPDDAARAEHVLKTTIAEGGVFSCYHRVIDSEERTRFVVSVGRGITNDEGGVVSVEGYFVDLSAPRRDDVQQEVHHALDGILAHRPVIDQALGMIMMAFSCDSDEAFVKLRACSQHANIKVRDVAERLVTSETAAGEIRVADVLDEASTVGPVTRTSG